MEKYKRKFDEAWKPTGKAKPGPKIGTIHSASGSASLQKKLDDAEKKSQENIKLGEIVLKITHKYSKPYDIGMALLNELEKEGYIK